VSATVQNKRYYGVLIEQAALEAASILYFQNEASGLDLNRRMQAMLASGMSQKNSNNSMASKNFGKRPHEDKSTGQGGDPNTIKKLKFDNIGEYCALTTIVPNVSLDATPQVQKFRYIPGENGASTGGYRLLLATFANVDSAAEHDLEHAQEILNACQTGGRFVGKYYYQYLTTKTTLKAADDQVESSEGMRMSMGLETFLTCTPLPSWFPLSNLQVAQQKVLEMLSMKKDSNGNVIWNDKSMPIPIMGLAGTERDTIPMEPRSFGYRVVVVGGGIAGLACCLELFRESEREGIDLEVILVEARSRLGGRLWTDRQTFKSADQSSAFPVDLGASWIHGIDQNPLAALAREAGVDFVTTSEEVKMLRAGMEEVDSEKDEKAGQLFDTLLDHAADDLWGSKARSSAGVSQSAIRWYASELRREGEGGEPLRTAPASHRRSSDISVDQAIGRAIEKHKSAEFALLSDEERRMLFWNLKNVEYALGANVADLSMKFWDIDERHAFEGDHVILKQGYSTVVEHLASVLARYGDRFKVESDFPVGKLEYARQTATQSYFSSSSRHQHLVELSDTCRVTSENGKRSFFCDFVVCAVPLGVLKESIENGESGKDKLNFFPQLPFSKRDAIGAVGFGLLNKVYLQFPFPFWRGTSTMREGQTLFGNASGINPHHYMFFDIGKGITGSDSAPAILMSLISGKEAVKSESIPETQVVAEAVSTLRSLFAKVEVPYPTTFKVTRWGMDRFSRGSYTYLPPGTTDQDFQLLQSPVNGHGDSLLLEGSSEIMRLFFAGEHTTALHPSMAHGALLSGIRAAKEVVRSMSFAFFDDEHIDRVIPIALYRHLNPKRSLECAFCLREGTSVREGTLIAFKRGSRELLAHNNCAENCPEVEVAEGRWKDVIKACNRSKSIECCICKTAGAAIGCVDANCSRPFHFSCAEDTGWRFELDGKSFECDLHRETDRYDSNRISMDYYLSKQQPNETIACALCGMEEDFKDAGPLLPFQQGLRSDAVHEHCARYTTIVDTTPDPMSRFEKEFRHVFEAIDRSGICVECGVKGGTIGCSYPSCADLYHFPCAKSTGWKFKESHPKFRCPYHRDFSSDGTSQPSNRKAPEHAGHRGLFQHALFSLESPQNEDTPGHLDMPGTALAPELQSITSSARDTSDSENEVDEKTLPEPLSKGRLDRPLTSELEPDAFTENIFARLYRPSLRHRWYLGFEATQIPLTRNSLLSVTACHENNSIDGMKIGDVVMAVNGNSIGSEGLESIEKVLIFLSKEVDVIVEVLRQIKI
jgi:monoamine oxidase